MKTATGLVVIAVGAILAFAINVNSSAFNINIVGYILIVLGVVGLIIPKRGYATVSRRLVSTRTRRSFPAGGGTVVTQETEVPPYVVTNPRAEVIEDDTVTQLPSIPPDPTVAQVMTPGEATAPGGPEVVQQLRDE